MIEVQGTAEGPAFTRPELNTLLDLAQEGIRDLTQLQKEAFQ
jgi:ribonuclease PH